MQPAFVLPVRPIAVSRSGLKPAYLSDSGKTACRASEQVGTIDWSWLSLYGQSTAGWVKKTGKNPTDRSKQGVKRSLPTV